MEPLRDRVVTGLLQASLVCSFLHLQNWKDCWNYTLWCYIYVFIFINYIYSTYIFQDGLLRVLLNGGPFRVFFPSDAKQLEEDLEILKVFAHGLLSDINNWEFRVLVYYKDVVSFKRNLHKLLLEICWKLSLCLLENAFKYDLMSHLIL